MQDMTIGPQVVAAGVNQARVRDHNERIVMTIIQRNGGLPGIEIARRCGLSPQTVSVILRSLEADGFLERGEPLRGKVGKPSVPMLLHPDGVLSVGLKIGRRSAELALLDFLGQVRFSAQTAYALPLPGTVFGFLRKGLAEIHDSLTPKQRQRIIGIGIASPFEIWNWHDSLGARQEELDVWRGLSFAEEVAKFSDLPVHVENDATAACRAEHVFGLGSRIGDFAYFFIGSFVGGGIVLNQSVYDGRQSNAGAFGSMPVRGPDGNTCQLIDTASLHLLENRLRGIGVNPGRLWTRPQDWSGFDAAVSDWIGEAAASLAAAVVSVISVIDFADFVIDGAMPPEVRARLVEETRRHLLRQDLRGLALPELHEGTVGGDARSIGAAAVPVFSRFLLNSHAGYI
ncbi:ROK family transcriptional regulator [Oceaniglobus roseus]|uniref:ROK family transcriptional regulator n=1 Tax=Oceaniglobus roseus TaxID=1737570 RepID=UPI000C7E8857|nr:ROK family transcriptional regulator [Kandeliimicrobium roseum]